MSRPESTLGSTASSTSSSNVGSQEMSSLPRFHPGVLAGRHLSAPLSATDELSCHWCGSAFVQGDQILLDVYNQPSSASSTLKLGREVHRLPKTTMFLVHANPERDCLNYAINQLHHAHLQDIYIDDRPVTEASLKGPDLQAFVDDFAWAIDWIDWHHQYALKGKLRMTFSSDQSSLTQHTCPSFSFNMSAPASSNGIRPSLPWELVTGEFVETFLCRIYVIDFSYDGEWNLAKRLPKIFEAKYKEGQFKVGVDAFLYNPPMKGFRAEEEVRHRLVVKTRPTPAQVSEIMQFYDENPEMRTWAEFTKRMGPGGNPEFDQIQQETLIAIRDCLADTKLETDLDTYLPRAISAIDTDQTKQEVIFECEANMYAPKAGAPDTYFFFMEPIPMHDCPILCYDGVLKKNVPIIYADVVAMKSELAEAGLRRVELPLLSTVFTNPSSE